MSDEPVRLPRERAARARERIGALLADRHLLAGGRRGDIAPRINASLTAFTVQHTTLVNVLAELGVLHLGVFEERLAEAFEEMLAEIETPPDRRPPSVTH